MFPAEMESNKIDSCWTGHDHVVGGYRLLAGSGVGHGVVGVGDDVHVVVKPDGKRKLSLCTPEGQFQ
jgi:hypothetical protein